MESGVSVPLKRVLVLYIGGTIGMQQTSGGWAPCRGLLGRLLQGNGKFHDASQPAGTMCVSQWGARVRWTLWEREELLDSSDMDHTDWRWVAQRVQEQYHNYEGFVLIQGTDTMTYTAAALSFMLRYLQKGDQDHYHTVVITGSQVPMLLLPNDAEGNLFGAINIAAHFEIPEVCVFFNGVMTRGNRTTKFDASGFDAFVSHNYPPLLKWGPQLEINWGAVRTAAEVEFLQYPFSIMTNMCNEVAVIRFFPGISESFLRSALLPPLKGCVLMTYGQGNVSLKAKHILQTLKEASDRGVLLVNITQCPRGSTSASYATGRALLDVGVEPGYDMTVEAAVCKLGFLLGLVELGEMTLSEAKQRISVPLRGELTAPVSVRSFSFRDGSFIQAVVKTMEKLLQPSDTELEASISHAILPVLMCSAAAQGDVQSVESVLRQPQRAGHGVSINSADYEQRTALQLASMKGHLDMVKFLLLNGADVNIADRHQQTALDHANAGGFQVVADLLKEHGAKTGKEIYNSEGDK